MQKNKLNWPEAHLLDAFLEEYLYKGITKVRLVDGKIYAYIKDVKLLETLPKEFKSLKVEYYVESYLVGDNLV